MFCNKCGAAIEADWRYCRQCGAAAATDAPAANPAVHSGSKLARRLPVLAVLWLIYGLLEATRAAAVHLFTRLSQFWWNGPEWSHWAGPWVSFWIATWFLCSAVLAFAAAWGLHQRLSWGRTTAIVAAIFALTHPPFGLLLGLYTLVVLLSGDAGNQYQQMARV
ncbi:MAG TPA: zinc ribbon domain-containing protein [Terriglobales bacterium]|nr:zinc ribbon domain-containing protein [Terriglobales bacterium]